MFRILHFENKNTHEEYIYISEDLDFNPSEARLPDFTLSSDHQYDCDLKGALPIEAPLLAKL